MVLGIDTSNYTTSAAVLKDGIIENQKIMLSVKSGERGLRQSDAVFQHTVNLPEIMDGLDLTGIEAVGVSDKPRNTEGSYMPCFLAGVSAAVAVSKAAGVPLFKTSHQVGHILAALYSCNKLELVNRDFIAFHLSGGTTEALLVTHDEDEIIKAEIISQSLDLKAGQAIDRTGVMLGMSFPCGKELDAVSKLSNKEYKIKPTIIDGNCSLSGVENKAKRMIEENESEEDIAKFVLTYVANTVLSMLDCITEKYGVLPIVFSGGVSSNSLLRDTILKKYDAHFALPEFSLDNAAGVAIYASMKK